MEIDVDGVNAVIESLSTDDIHDRAKAEGRPCELCAAMGALERTDLVNLVCRRLVEDIAQPTAGEVSFAVTTAAVCGFIAGMKYQNARHIQEEFE